jgi:hypothetical protein
MDSSRASCRNRIMLHLPTRLWNQTVALEAEDDGLQGRATLTLCVNERTMAGLEAVYSHFLDCLGD